MSAILTGVIDKILFASPGGRFMIVRCRVEERKEPVTMKGQGVLVEGQKFRAIGSWEKDGDKRYFAQQKISVNLDFDEETAIHFLSDGCLKGVGYKKAERVIRAFDSIEAFERAIENPRHVRIEKIGYPTLLEIARYWWRERGFLFLSGFYFDDPKISAQSIARLAEALGRESFNLPDNPQVIYGVASLSQRDVETLAAKFSDNPSLQGLHTIMKFLRQATDKGHTGAPIEKVVEVLRKHHNYPAQEARNLIEQFVSGTHSRLVIQDELVFPDYTANAELEISRRILDMLGEPMPEPANLDEVITEMAQDLKFNLSDEQHAAVRTMVSSRISILTGGPGCGKTATLAVALRVFAYYQRTTALAAPTGKAGQRAEESTGHAASTVHRLLGISNSSQQPNTLDCDVLLVDEISMADIYLMLAILRALSPLHQLILVGDADQLPSIGPGAVLRDLIDSWVIPVARLTKVFRQAAGSLIITNANRIRLGESIINGRSPASSDFVVLHEGNVPRIRAILEGPKEQQDRRLDEAVSDLVRQLVCDRLPKLGYDPIKDVWVLPPVLKGTTGVYALNKMLQSRLVPPGGETIRNKQFQFSKGDRVMQTRNNRDLGIYNGDTGWVTRVDLRKKECWVDFGGDRHLPIGPDAIDQLELAYAISIHKSQGSQSPVVVMPLIPSYGIMLQRSLFYTGITRAKKLVVVVGVQEAISKAIANNQAANRYTGLSGWLINMPAWENVNATT